MVSIMTKDGIDIEVRPIAEEELGRVLLRCWPDKETIKKLFAKQGTIGMAAWDGEKCVAQLHCYRVDFPEAKRDLWPQWNQWDLHADELDIDGPVWCHTCCHVGRTLESGHNEMLRLIRRFAKENEWEWEPTLQALDRLDGVFLSEADVRNAIDELQSADTILTEDVETRYRGQGIATALCRESIEWAKAQNYVAVLTPATPTGLPAVSDQLGTLSWMTYKKMGFDVAHEYQGEELPDLRFSPPEAAKQIQDALASGREAKDLHGRVMIKHL
jgi:GNAT superfamily N-acetyltransferase